MSEFKVIETQEQLDAIISERVKRAEKRAEEKAAEKYADYDSLKDKASAYEKQIADLSEQLKSGESKLAEFTTEKEGLEAKIKEYETASIKTKIALETGLPHQLAEKLTGDDEEAIRADAKKMAEFVAKPTAPIGSAEPDRTDDDSTGSALFDMARQLGKEY